MANLTKLKELIEKQEETQVRVEGIETFLEEYNNFKEDAEDTSFRIEVVGDYETIGLNLQDLFPKTEVKVIRALEELLKNEKIKLDRANAKIKQL